MMGLQGTSRDDHKHGICPRGCPSLPTLSSTAILNGIVILTAVIQGMRREEPNYDVRLAGTTALLNALEFVKALCQISLSMRGRDLPTRGKRLGKRGCQHVCWEGERRNAGAGAKGVARGTC